MSLRSGPTVDNFIIIFRLSRRPGVLPGVAVTHEIAVHTLELVPNTSDQVLICTNSPHAYIMTVQGQPVRRFSSGKQPGAGGDFNCATMSPQGTRPGGLYFCAVPQFGWRELHKR
jgi:hypothetical protein